jgi:hypothetical protein
MDSAKKAEIRARLAVGLTVCRVCRRYLEFHTEAEIADCFTATTRRAQQSAEHGQEESRDE